RVLALGAHEDLVLGAVEVFLVHAVAAVTRGHQGGLVDEVLEVGAAEARGAAGDAVDVDAVVAGAHAGVNLEDGLAAAHVREADDDAAVEAARPEQGRVEHVGAVGGGDEDDAVVALKAVHLDEQLVEGLLALVVTAAEASAAVATDGVDLVDEDDAGGVLLALLEQVADAAGADADEHLDEVRAADAEERDPGLAGDRLGEQGLAGARRAHQQHALGDPAADAQVLAGVAEEVDDLLDVLAGLVDASDILEGDLVVVLVEQAGLALAEVHGPAAAGLHLTHEHDHQDDDEDQRQVHQRELQ